jgi:NADH-quinone oxidoreductase subunit G
MSDARPKLNVEIDGRAVQVDGGSTIMEAAQKLDIYVPHFCWHRKLTIAANCRMCLVQVEKAPKPLPACATPVTEGMKVWTHSDTAVDAQKGVMEFLLINHPLDCPICDQGGECQLQDLAVGYGASNSRYQEPKRVVLNKNLGPLISTDMTRCIHCTRCVRFGTEIAGVMELGMIGRGEHAEIITFVGKTVDSELSGNVIDLCPVGALTSKPFRYTARTWELARRKSIAPHDSLGSNLIVQVKGERVMRVVPRENEAINECWLSDKDRFSYEGLNSEDRLTQPMVKRDGHWHETSWSVALEVVANELKRIRDQHGGASVGALVSPHSTLEEMHLAQKLVRGVGSDSIDFRLRQSDFSTDGKRDGATWLGMSIAEVAALDRALVIGSFLRKDHPLLAHRLRQRAKQGAEISLVHTVDDEQLIAFKHKAIVQPSALPRLMAEIAVAAAQAAGKSAPTQLPGVEASELAKNIAASLAAGARRAVLLGSFAGWHPRATQLHALAQSIAESTGATLGFLTEAANSVGGTIAGAFPRHDGLNAAAMVRDPRKAYLLLHVDPELDTADPIATRAALGAAEFVVALSPFRSGVLEHAHVLLPVAPFTETAGTFVNCEGRAQSFTNVVLPLMQTRPAWKVLRVLGSMLGIAGFGYETIEAVRAELPHADDIGNWLSNTTQASIEAPATPMNGSTLERIADVPIYFADPLVRRSPSLQKTRDALPPRARAHPATLSKLGLADGASIRVKQGEGQAVLTLSADAGIPEGCVRVAAAHPSTRALGPMFGSLVLEPA